MRTHTFLTTVSLCLCGLYAIGGAQSKANDSDVQKRFVGHWRLVKFENFDEKGVARVAGYDGGRIMYDAAGQMSAQLMRSDRKPLAMPSTEPDRAAAYATYTAYYGKYTIDPALGKVTHHVEGALNHNWVKTDLVRWYAFAPDGNQLMLSIKNAEGRVTGTLTWERLR
jgi:Lipocalin-like domain